MHPRELSIADFSYDLPEDRIAQRPLDDRSASRLLVMREGLIRDGVFSDLPEQLPSGSLLVLNDTRVVNARVVFHRATGARIELLCLSPADGGPVERSFAERGQSDWNCFIGNAKRWKEGEQLILEVDGTKLYADRLSMEVVRFTWDPPERSFADVLNRFGHVPLPPYMKRPDEPADAVRYNTVFARHEGSVAAPTASLHFSDEVLQVLNDQGVSTAELTLHVGAGTFLPVKSERMHDHRMHEEQVRISRAAIEVVRERLENGPIVAVGTTAMRTLESLYWHGLRLFHGEGLTAMDVGQWEPYETEGAVAPAEALDAVLRDLQSRGEDRLTGRTSLLIAPGYRFRYADALITNFHQPQSTLLLLVAAFVGSEWRKAYEHALSHGYRFLSYGDGSLLWRKDAR